MMIIVDRIEGGLAVCEGPDRSRLTIPLEQLPAGVKEGDCLREQDGAYTADEAETARRRRANADLLRSLLKDD